MGGGWAGIGVGLGGAEGSHPIDQLDEEISFGRSVVRSGVSRKAGILRRAARHDIPAWLRAGA